MRQCGWHPLAGMSIPKHLPVPYIFGTRGDILATGSQGFQMYYIYIYTCIHRELILEPGVGSRYLIEWQEPLRFHFFFRRAWYL